MRPPAALLLALFLVAPAPLYAAPPGDPAGWTLTWHDEFDGSSLDTSKWITTYVDGVRTLSSNAELEWYVDDAAHHVVSDGTLKLIAVHETTEPGYPYTSGMINSLGKFYQMYGYFEARLKIPSGQGLWPAFWLTPDPWTWPPEIDVMENIGSTDVYFNVHHTNNYPAIGGGYGGGDQGSYTVTNLSADFHTFGCLWTDSAVTFYVDDIERDQMTAYVPVAGYGFDGLNLMLNLAVGGTWPGTPSDPGMFPKQLEVDWVRVYEPAGPVPFTAPRAGGSFSGGWRR